MARDAGERFKCDQCGAEIVYVKACPCPPKEPSQHAEICCGKEMRGLGVVAQPEKSTAPT